mmetsp:Transcript_33904/g.60817  ORF Transcript_33904/g.60817 Transcript_33904/m.60817 type:complete len:85 (+) Transcript_33904:264-518(+)
MPQIGAHCLNVFKTCGPAELQTLFVPSGVGSLLRISPWQVECVAGAQLDWVAAMLAIVHVNYITLASLNGHQSPSYWGAESERE